MGRILYNAVVCLAAILALPLGAVASLFVEKRRATFLPRLGFQAFPRENRPLWIHALSVGEANAAAPLVRALARRHPGLPIVFSASTLTGLNTARAALQGKAAAFFYFPFDLPFSVKQAVARVNPRAVVLVESDIWPNFVHEVKKQGIPLILANGRLSPSSYEGYRKMGCVMRPVFGAFDAVCCQSEQERELFAAVGAEPGRITVTGNLKFDMELDSASPDIPNLTLWQAPLIVAGSTHPGEENLLAALHKQWRDRHGAVLVAAPRDPKRARAVQEAFARAGFSTQLLSQARQQSDVVVVDRMGALAGLYAQAHVCFVGGSLKPFGGHNPLEPAFFSRPVLFGPDMGDFPQVSRMLVESGGAVQVRDARELGEAVMHLLDDPESARAMGKKAREFVEANQGAVHKTLETLNRILESQGMPP